MPTSFRLPFWLAMFLLPFGNFNAAFGCDGGLTTKIKRISVHSFRTNGRTELEFKATLKKFEKIFSPQVEDERDAELVVIGSWGTDTVNAFADQKPGQFLITIFGGLARHPELTPDGFATVLCHELGHHLGGYPKKFPNRWSSAEGQADYFATLKCLRKFWKNEDHSAALPNGPLPEILKRECESSSPNLQERQLCLRAGLAGKSFSRFIQDLDAEEAEPLLETPDASAVPYTNEMYPSAQCRLDTLFQGALCAASPSVPLDDIDEKIGSCHLKLGHQRGLRPACWFRSRG
jgi:hypothetical protein